MNIIKTANAVMKRHRISAAFVTILPLCIILFTALIEYLIFAYFFPFVTGKLKYTIIVSSVLALDMIILWPIKVGKKNWFLQLYLRNEGDISGLFYYFSSFLLFISSITLMLLKRIYFAAICIVCFVPGAVIFRYFSQIEPSNAGVFCGIALLIIGAVFAIKSLLSMFLADYIYISETKNPFKAFGLSLVKIRKHRISLIFLLLKFWWRILLCIFVLPLIYVAPLICQSAAIFADSIIAESCHLSPPASPSDNETEDA